MSAGGKYAVLMALYAGYVMHTYSRRSFQNVINYTLKEAYLDTETIGLIVSAQQLGYTFCKFVQPFIIDTLNPKVFFTLTMVMTFICILSFAYSTSFYQFIILYWIHGFSLAFAWPSLAKILKQIIPQREFGFWWSVECTSSNLGAIFGALISTFISDRFGWRSSLKICALVNICVAVIVATILVLAPFTIVRLDSKIQARYANVELSYIDFIFNPVLFANNIMFFCVYICRYVIADWYQIHLLSMQYSQVRIAGFISSMEIGGTLGSLVAGIMADYLYITLTEVKNPRLLVIITCGGLTAAVMHMLIFVINKNTSQFVLCLLGFLFGTFIYGPVAVGGIIAIEGAPPQQQGMSFALNIIFANVAMLVTGYPVSYLGQEFGWRFVFLLSYFLMCASTMFLLFFRNHSTPVEKLDAIDRRRSVSIKIMRSTEFDLSE